MLRPIPARVLKHNIVVNVCTGIDRDQNPTYGESHSVSNVFMQPSSETRKSKDNTAVSLRGVCFIDARLSFPSLDYDALKAQSEAAGSSMTIDFNGSTYTVMMVDSVYGDLGVLHHTEIGVL